MLELSERMGFFIDGANIHATARALRFDVDYSKLLKSRNLFGRNQKLVCAYYYTAVLPDSEINPLRPLVDFLSHNGYRVRTKPVREFTDPHGRKIIKGNMDMELALDAMIQAEFLDHIVLFTGDGDFVRLVDEVQRKNCRVTVVSTIKVQPPMIADVLRKQADAFLDLYDLRDVLERDDA